ncbi:MAG: dihydroorotase [Gammaproteobacteria bacterium]|nr:dihydroorotase [Gammaproteobacteria bacterium]
MQRLSITRPDDWHVHLRDGAALSAVVNFTARQFRRAIVMPNLAPAVTRVADAAAYRDRILAAVDPALHFEPLMTLYLTDQTPASEIIAAANSGIVMAIKLYPAGATTHSNAGVTEITRVYPAIAAMEERGVPLLVHAETTDPHVDVFDREKVYIERVLVPLIARFPKLKMVFEHLTTKEGVAFVQHAPRNVAATLTAHHLLYNRNAMFQGGIRPHFYCLPVLKREEHRTALLSAAVSGSPKFFLGTDTAPHARGKKEHACGCAGMFTAPCALELYAEAFEQANALDKLEGFAAHFGAEFYGLPRNPDKITLVKDTWTMPDHYAFADDVIVPIRANEQVRWRIA